ncbi:MAG: M20/M25/M40 family metallo-hydrolase [Spirochaetaceae bacterium]|jgi:carboxypeptidase PM20D1|nr:M20/M25/M40 family metallo-hydrolase [Spirochaetaceae bacterium]
MFFILIALSLLFCFIAAVLISTFLFRPPRGRPDAAPYDPGDIPEEVLGRLTKAVTFPTICTQDYTGTDFAPFEDFIAFLAEAYPLFHQTCSLERVNGYALVYRWKGMDTSLRPMMLTAHYDVVPVEEGTEAEWKYPPFSGAVAEGRIWGRGTLDIKSQITAHMEAAETLMRRNFVPKRDFYFVYGQDEETGGRNGAYKTADYFAERGIHFEGVLDEGGFAVSGVIKGVAATLALIGTAEKGFANYELTLEGEGGHSSMPPAHTALGNAARLIAAIESLPLPSRLTAPVLRLLRNIAGEMGFVTRMAVANIRIFKPLILKILSANYITNAMVRTTFAATMARAGSAANVLPQKAQAIINVRLLPGDSVEGVSAYFKKIAGKLKLPLTVRVLTAEEPSQVSPAEGTVYRRLITLIDEIFPGVISSPYLVMGGTDARKYYKVCDHVYRFTPMLVTNEEKDTAHSTNESVTVANYGRAIHFFIRFIEGFDT